MINAANIITGLRIVLSFVLLFFSSLSPAFYTLYAAAGLTDMIDGTVARKTNTVSAFGAKLDTIADFVFVALCLIKLLPVLDIPVMALLRKLRTMQLKELKQSKKQVLQNQNIC